VEGVAQSRCELNKVAGARRAKHKTRVPPFSPAQQLPGHDEATAYFRRRRTNPPFIWLELTKDVRR